MNSVFRLSFVDCNPDRSLSEFLAETTHNDIAQFQIPKLPENNRITINILTKDEFVRRRFLRRLEMKPFASLVAYVDSSIHAIQFKEIAFLSRECYLKILRHECVHILQLLASQVRPTSFEWLYESVACAVAEQQQEIREAVPSWETFSQCFYTIPNCYAIAYKFGVALLDHYTIPEMMRLSKSRDKCTSSCRQLYQKLFNR